MGWSSDSGRLCRRAEWLRKDLSATRQPWKLVAIHRPAYGGSQDEKVLKRWAPVFDEFGVDLVLQGHNHEYSRSYPMTNNRITGDKEGTVYVVANTSGPKFNEKKDDQFYHRVHFQNNKQMFAGIRVGQDALTYEAYDADGRKLDEFVLRR
ncbi:metallophosphoesterase family protein [Paenibacillus sp. y28]|uniref:metallophosphoesterase family protein n=1 Tax=Paenibacillus sp. y28 TaxID=3129110 RepID=UPI0030176E6D